MTAFYKIPVGIVTGRLGRTRICYCGECVVSTSSGNSSQMPDAQNVDPAGVNPQEFQTFYQENLGLIYRYVYSKVGNRQEAEDLTSQIFVKAVRSIDGLRGLKSMQKWLFQVARTTIADHWRAYYRASVGSLDELLEAGWEGPVEDDPAAPTQSATERVQQILQMLPEQYREVLACRFLLNLTIKETAIRLRLTEANVKVLQFRALQRASRFQPPVNVHHEDN